jgi:hypothetical protein
VLLTSTLPSRTVSIWALRIEAAKASMSNKLNFFILRLLRAAKVKKLKAKKNVLYNHQIKTNEQFS